MERPWDLTDELKIKKFEKDFGFKLPTEYRDFLLTHNGGAPTDILTYEFKMGSRQSSSTIQVFYGLGGTEWGDLAEAIDTFHVHRRRMPDYLFPFACDGLGNQLCINLDGPRYGEILHWEMEEEVEFDQSKKRWVKDPLSNCYKISDSFTNFIRNMKVEEV
jgi:cell wall assembly regulator SMI1